MPSTPVIISYLRTNQHEAADNMRRHFASVGYSNVQVVMGGTATVTIDDKASPQHFTWEAAENFLYDIVRRLPIKLVPLDHFPQGYTLPDYETRGSAGMDIRAAVSETITLSPGERRLIPTGLSMAIPEGYEVQVRPRSGLAVKNGVTVLNTPGTIDSDYRGEVKVPLINHGLEPFEIKAGDRIAQIVIAPVTQARWEVVDSLDETARGTGGFGSTGVG